MYKLFLISVIIIVFNFETHPQISVNTSEKFNERGYLNSSSKFGEGNEVISDYDGNFNLVYTRDMNLPNSMGGKITLVYNPNVEHRAFMDLNWADQEGYPVNAPEWIIGFNDFALQTFNFEVNFFSHKAGNINDLFNLSGEQTPLLIPGYHYTNKIWSTHNGMPPDYNELDVIQILMADGSKTTLYNTLPQRFDGSYIQSGTDQVGYAKVKTYNQEKMLREMWYKKGDGLTYYFIEENLKYIGAPTNAYQFKPKAMYLRRVFNSYGDTLNFNYNNDTVYYNSLSNIILPDSVGRKLFSNIQISYQSSFTTGYMTRDLIPQSRLFELEYISLLLPPFNGVTPNILRQVKLQNFWNDDDIKLGILESNSTGSTWYSPGRLGGVYNSKIKMISSITDKIGRRDLITYQPINRSYRYGGQDPLFSFSCPAYLMNEIKYDNNKKVQLDFLASSNVYDYYHATNFLSDNDSFLRETKRDKRTNFMLNSKKVYSINDGISNLISTIQLIYGRDDGNTAFDPKVPAGECWTKLVTTNGQVGDNSSPISVTTKKTFKKIAIGERANHSQDYSSVIKLINEVIEENQTNKIEKKYYYALGNLISGFANYDFYTGSLWVDSIEVFTIKNEITNRKSIRYANNGVVPNWPSQRWYTGNKYILSQRSEFDNLGMSTTQGFKNFVPGISDFSDTVFYFNIGLPELERYSSPSQTISENKRVYFESGDDKGKLRKIISNSHLPGERHDTTYYNYKAVGTPHPVSVLNMPNLYKGILIGEDNPSRKIKTEYEYPILIDSLMYDPGGLQNIYNANGEIIGTIEVPARYKYFLKSTQTAKFVLTDGNIKDSTFTIFGSGFPKLPLITRMVYDRSGINDTLISRSIYNEKGNLIYKIDPYGYYSEYKYDELGRMIKANLPGSFPTSSVTYVDTFEVRLNDSPICERSILIRTNGDYYQNPEEVGIFGIGREIIGEEDKVMQEDSETELEQTDELIGGDPGSGGGGNPTPNTYYFAFFEDKIPTAKIISIPQAILRFRTKHYNVAPELNMKFKISAIVQEFQDGYLSYETIGSQIVDFQQNSLISIDVSQLLLSLKNENKDLYGFKFSADVDLYDQTKYKFFAFSVDTLPYLDCSLILEDIENSFTKGSFTYKYDDINRKVQINKRFSFDPLNPKRSLEILEYDVLGNLTKSKALDDLGVEETKSTMTYNYLGLTSKVTDAENRNLFNKYDYFSRAKETRVVTDDVGAPKIRYEYDPINHTTEYEKQTIFDESNNKTEKVLDKSGKILREIKYDNSVPFITTYSYNTLQQLAAVITPNNKTTNYFYDDLGNISKKVDPNSGTVQFKYDRFKQLRFEVQNSQLLSTDSIIFNSYDSFSRLKIRGMKDNASEFSALNPDQTYTFESDTSKLLVVNMYDKYYKSGVFTNMPDPYVSTTIIKYGNHKGRLVATAFRNKLGEPWSFKVYSYDAVGRVDDFWIKYENQSWKWVKNSYDHAGNLTKQCVEGDMYYWYDYDSQSRLIEVRTSIHDNKSTAKLEAVYSYNKDNKISRLIFSDLQTTYDKINYTYDNRGRLLNISNLYNYTDGEILIRDYPRFIEGLTYYPNGNIEYQYLKNTGIPNSQDLMFNFIYDGLNRLTTTKNFGSNYEWYTYDPDGNFITKTRSGKHMIYTPFPGTDRLQKVDIGGVDKFYQYDNRGNVISDGLRQISSISYDRRNLPLSMTTTTGTNFKYKYDDNGNRLIKQTNGIKEYYLRDNTGKELAVYNLYTSRIKMANLYGNGLLGKANVRWDSVLTEVDPGNWEYVYSRIDERHYYIKDHLGNIRIVLDKDGEVVSAQDYYPFGEIISTRSHVGGGSVNDKYKFTEKERDTETNYDYFGARYYDSELGRWLQVDPLADKYLGVSPYSFTGLNPVKNLEIDGRFYITYHWQINWTLKEYLSDAQIGAINTVHLKIDLPKLWYKDYEHFDNEKLDEGWDFINSINSSSSFYDFAVSLHTIQDFYSHSNFVELALDYFGSEESVPRFEEALQDKNFAEIWKKSGTTGYYNKKTPKGKKTHDELHKDNPGRKNFSLAMKLATKDSEHHTKKYLNKKNFNKKWDDKYSPENSNP